MEIPRARPHLRIEPRHSLEIVVEHVRPRLDHRFERRGRAFQEIRRQHFDRRLRRLAPHRPDRLGDMLGPAILKVIAVDRGDHHMVQPQLLDRHRDPARLEHVQLLRPPRRDVAERAAPRADLAHDHHGRVTLAPAFPDVRAAGLLADRRQTVLAHDPAGPEIALTTRRLHPDPVRLAQNRRIRLVRLLRMPLRPVAEIPFRHLVLPIPAF